MSDRRQYRARLLRRMLYFLLTNTFTKMLAGTCLSLAIIIPTMFYVGPFHGLMVAVLIAFIVFVYYIDFFVNP